MTYREISIGEVGDDPAPPPAALLAGEVDMAARAGAGSLPAPLPMQRYGKISCCVYAALSANTKCKAGVLSVLSCVASNARLKRGPSGIVVQRQDT